MGGAHIGEFDGGDKIKREGKNEFGSARQGAECESVGAGFDCAGMVNK